MCDKGRDVYACPMGERLKSTARILTGQIRRALSRPMQAGCHQARPHGLGLFVGPARSPVSAGTFLSFTFNQPFAALRGASIAQRMRSGVSGKS